MGTELEIAQQRIAELEGILHEFVRMFDGMPDGQPLAYHIKCGPFYSAKEALGMIPRRRDFRQTELPL